MTHPILTILERLVDEGATSIREVDLVDQAALQAEGYMLCALDRDLALLHQREGIRD